MDRSVGVLVRCLDAEGFADVTVNTQAEFAPLECVDGSKLPWPPHTNVTLSPEHPGWTFKAFALHSTSFREVGHCMAPELCIVFAHC